MSKNNYFTDLLDDIGLEKVITEDESKNNSKEECKDNNKEKSKSNSKNNNKIDSKKINSSNLLDFLPDGKKDHKRFYKGIYFDEDIYNVLTSIVLQKGGGRRNIQSKIVNDCLREALENRKFL